MKSSNFRRFSTKWVNLFMELKSLYINHVVSNLYGTEIEIWAAFGPVWQLLRPFFSCFHGQKKVLKNIVDCENIFGIE